GYTGAELMRLLAGHDGVELTVITSRTAAGRSVADLFPSLRGWVDLEFSDPDESGLSQCDVVFSATPNGVAMKQAPDLVDNGVRIIDLAADFRLQDPLAWETWYGQVHTSPELLAEAVYGLPEINRDAIRTARVVANPGCYPTAVQLGFFPLLKAELVESKGLIADAKSGVSGAGRTLTPSSLYCEVADSIKAYAVDGHRHLP
ncbi:MAG: N-acetyl-gamma-glutamyl-phosphate reductase, partial [Arenicellales bacterium]|nr:N-acetyl-gamma-glutamyl-phosphate reductase [Arenicellales bacterium]